MNKLRSSRLSAVQRRAVWEHIKATDAPRAELIQDVMAEFSAADLGPVMVFEQSDVNAALESAGLPTIQM